MDTKKPIAEFANELSDAYSTGGYRNGWNGCIRMLRKRGMNDKQIEAIIRSKWTRWAGDNSPRQYGQRTSTDLARFLDTMKNLETELAELVAESFPNDTNAA